MKNNKSIFRPIRLVGALVFLMAFVLNIQTSLNGDWDLVNVGFAQGSGGSGGSGDDSPCTAYDYDNMLLKNVMCVLPWQQSLQCKLPASGKCCKAESQKTCSGAGWPTIPG